MSARWGSLGAGRRTSAVLTVVVGLSLVVAVGGTARATAGDIGYLDGSYTGANNPPTSDKPQSKLWYNDGSWWADMFDPVSLTWHIFRLNRPTETWVDTGTVIDNRTASLADVLWDGSHLYVGSHYTTVSSTSTPKAAVSGKPARLYRFSYSASTKKYTLDAGYPTQISNYSSESLTIDKDSKGLIWATWTQVSGSSTAGFTNTVYVNNTVAGDKTWATPTVIPVAGANPDPDDISAVVAYGKSKVGVLWSNQRDDTVYWAWRNDTEPTSTWHGGVAVRGSHLPDDHMNLKTLQSDTAGRVFAAVKTSLDATSPLTSSNPQLNLLVFKPATGSWSTTTFGSIADCHTRPLVMLDTTNSRVHVFATAPSSGGCPYSGAPGTIYEKSAPLDNPVFPSGRGTPVIRDAASANMNDATSTKQSVDASTGLVVLASNSATKRYWHADLSLGTVVKPVASFGTSTNSGTAPLGVQFTDTSTGSPTSWAWNFGDGTTSTQQSPLHTYQSAGSFSVTLTATNSAGSTTASGTITVSAPSAPTASFTASATSGTAPLSVTFTDTSTGSPTSWAWNFGDGATSTEQNPAHSFAAGTWRVSLTASNAGGPSTAATATVTVTAPTSAPTASFTASATSGTAPLSVTFTDTSTGSPTSWAWDFGDGATSTEQNPTHSFAAGTWTVSLVATAGTTSSLPAVRQITVDPATSGSIVRESVATTVVTTAATGITIDKPAGTTTGDVLVSCLTLNGSKVSSTPAGWTQLAASTGVSNPKVYGFYKVATASEPASYSWTFAASIVSGGGIARYSGSSGPDGPASTAAGLAGTPATVPSVTTTSANAMLVGCMGINSGSTTITISPPSGLTSAWDIGGKRHEVADGLQASAGSSGDRTWTFSAARDWAGWLVPLRAQ